jgi:hypothetical protein
MTATMRPFESIPIRLSAHAAGYMSKRGFTTGEVEQAIRTGSWEPAELGRLETRVNFPFRGVWNGRYFETRQVRPIFVEEADEILVVTVYTYYF